MNTINENRKKFELKYHELVFAPGMLQRLKVIVDLFFRLPFLKKVGQKNAQNVGLNQLKLRLKNLPAKFNGCKILFITDLHIEMIAGLAEKIIHIADQLEYDYCILGGDYGFVFHAKYKEMIHHLHKVIKFLVKKSQVFGILGNYLDGLSYSNRRKKTCA